MRKPFYVFLLLFSIAINSKAAVYQTPGTGVNWTLSDLVANSAGIVTFNGTEYLFTDSVTVLAGDVLRIETDATVKFNAQVVLRIYGSLIINPPTGVLFTAADIALPYRGVWLDLSSGSSFSKLTYEYASSFRLTDSSPSFDQCVFRFNTGTTLLSNSALSLFRSSPIITNCQFLNNWRAAIQGGSNIENAPKIYNSVFSGNNTSNQNVPQINLGSSGADTTKIIGCQIVNPGGIRTGAIGFLPTGTVHTLITQNHIANNRYGISLNGGSNINAMVSYNYIGFNNIENDPNLGGSGIAFGGGSSSSHQNSIVTGNTFEGNLWGITILRLSSGVPISGSMPNLGNLANADTSDNGKNRFINNTNAGTPGIDLYNNSADPIFAQGNYWNTNIPSEVEGKIFHQFDNPALGLVDYGNFVVPVTLVSFDAARENNDVKLSWQTAQELNSDHFVVERSYDGTNFTNIATVDAAGNSSTILQYSYTDVNANSFGGRVYYRLKMLDTDGTSAYSPIKLLNFAAIAKSFVHKVAPTLLTAAEQVNIEMASDRDQLIHMQLVDAVGRILKIQKTNVQAGLNRVPFIIPANAQKGVLFIRMHAHAFEETIRVVIQ